MIKLASEDSLTSRFFQRSSAKHSSTAMNTASCFCHGGWGGGWGLRPRPEATLKLVHNADEQKEKFIVGILNVLEVLISPVSRIDTS